MAWQLGTGTGTPNTLNVRHGRVMAVCNVHSTFYIYAVHETSHYTLYITLDIRHHCTVRPLSTLHYTIQYIRQSTLGTVNATLYTVHCALLGLYYTPYIVHCIFYIIHSKLFTVNVTLFTIYCALSCLDCTFIYCSL